MKALLILLTLYNFLLSIDYTNNYNEEMVLNKDSASYYMNRASTLYYKGNIKESRQMYLKFLTFEQPKKITEVVLGKRLFFVPDSFIVPLKLEKDEFIIKPIKESHAELDYEAVMGSVEHLTGVLGRKDWPGNLTLEEDRYALKGHEWEFEKRTGFVYTVLNKSETKVMGCVYIYPSRLDDFNSEIVMWTTEKDYKRGIDEVLFKTVDDWIKKEWPFEKVIYPGREIAWGTFFEKLEIQDQKYIK